MKTWDIYAKVVASKYIGSVKAETEEEAIKLGWEHEDCHVSACHQCSHNFETPEIEELVVEEDA